MNGIKRRKGRRKRNGRIWEFEFVKVYENIAILSIHHLHDILKSQSRGGEGSRTVESTGGTSVQAET